MAEWMIGVRVSISRYVSDEPQPGIVECDFSDAHGRHWRFVEKTAIVSTEYLDAHTSYPQPGVIACEIVSRSRDAVGREIVRIDTERPWGVESLDKQRGLWCLVAGSLEFVLADGGTCETDWDDPLEFAQFARFVAARPERVHPSMESARAFVCSQLGATPDAGA